MREQAKRWSGRRLVSVVVILLAGGVPAAAQAPVGSTILVSATAEDGDDVEISADAEGNFAVVWESPALGLPGNPRDIFARFYAQDATPLGPVIPVNTETPSQPGDQHTPVVSHNRAGAAVVAWVNGDEFGTGNTAIRAQRFAPDGSKAHARFKIADGSRLTKPTLLHVPSGGYFAAWGDATTGLVRLRHFMGAKSNGPIVTVGVGAEPALSVAHDGSLVVTYSDAANVFARRLDASGQPIGEAIEVGSAPMSAFPDFGHARVAHATDGTFAVVWQSGDFLLGDQEVFMRRYSAAGAPLDAATTVSTTQLGSHRRPDLAHDGEGGYVVVWCRSAIDVRGRRFDESGVATSGEFQVDLGTEGLQACAAVDAFRGRFVAAWASEGPFGFYAHRFSTPAKVPSVQAVGACALSLTLCAFGTARLRGRRRPAVRSIRIRETDDESDSYGEAPSATGPRSPILHVGRGGRKRR